MNTKGLGLAAIITDLTNEVFNVEVKFPCVVKIRVNATFSEYNLTDALIDQLVVLGPTEYRGDMHILISEDSNMHISTYHMNNIKIRSQIHLYVYVRTYVHQ